MLFAALNAVGIRSLSLSAFVSIHLRPKAGNGNLLAIWANQFRLVI